MVKLTDVAQAAGVSVATVSRALNNNPRVDPELAARVHRAVEQLGYRRNGVARNLRRRHTQVWALIVTDVTNPFYTALARGVEDVASAAGYSVLLGNSDELPEKEARYLSVAEEERVAGVIIAPRDTRTDVSRLMASGIGVVAVDRRLPTEVDTVVAASLPGAARATEHLVEAGWRRPACVSGPSDAETAEHRVLGYQQALVERGLPALVERVPFHAADGRDAAGRLLDAADPPDAFFVANSVLALGVLAEIQARGLRLGADVGLITFDDAPWATLVSPPISVVTQPAYEIGSEAAQILADRLSGARTDTTPVLVEFDTELVIRPSSAGL